MSAAASTTRRAGDGTLSHGGSDAGRKIGTVGQLEARLTELQGLDLAELREEWRRLIGGEPPRLSRDLTQRAVAYALQELALGGLSPAARRQLEPSPGSPADKARNVRRAQPALPPGARLVREWRGRTHTIEVIERGFVFDGKTFRSLTEIARRITGAHWSGPRFFGLTKKRVVAMAVAADAARGAVAEAIDAVESAND